ncbi:hypothetical protein [Pelomonas sp. Root1217]|uniref:hypothetical protein n=1 Tax=Pelomonas sp. Root1217 TaxID=1736430 RepID=UPI0012F7A4D4|nr:hypothetical protein [Pelomonas sp. Root1217]
MEHRDRPDCVVTSNGSSIGIELTEAISENVARASVLRQAGVGPSVYFIPRALPGEPSKSTAELRREIELDKAGPPWIGDEPEREWAAAMLHFTTVKVEKAHKAGYSLHRRNWLLIYDNWSLPRVHYAEASAILAAKCSEANVFATFDRVFVLGSKLLCEVGKTVQIHEVRSPRVES